MEKESERDRKRREFIEALNDAEEILKKLNAQWDKIEAELEQKFPGKRKEYEGNCDSLSA